MQDGCGDAESFERLISLWIVVGEDVAGCESVTLTDQCEIRWESHVM